jgi:hypothetical protein
MCQRLLDHPVFIAYPELKERTEKSLMSNAQVSPSISSKISNWRISAQIKTMQQKLTNLSLHIIISTTLYRSVHEGIN